MPQNVELWPLQSRFEVVGAAPAKYWVLPLSNFLPDPWEGEPIPQLADHPLRLNSWPAVPDGLSDHERLMVTLHLRYHAGLYTFLLNGEPGFIERMPNFEARAKRVRRKRSRRITAVMVGPAHVQDVEWSDFASLFPLDILGMLSLAMGTPVGAPWIEFRDEKGALVRRVHICFGAGRFEKTHAAIPRHLASNGLGYLTGKILTAADRGQKYLRVAINHALGASNETTTLESRFISLCRGFETQCHPHGFINQNLSLRLEPAQQTELKAILREAATKIRKMKKAETDPGRKSVLETIESRARTPARRRIRSAWPWRTSPASSASMTPRYSTPILRLIRTPRARRGRASSPSTARRRRTTPTSTGTGGRTCTRSSASRITFTTCCSGCCSRRSGTNGRYQSPIAPLMHRDSVDWVTPTTPPGLLGFA